MGIKLNIVHGLNWHELPNRKKKKEKQFWARSMYVNQPEK